MKYIVTAAQMKQYDQNTIERIGIPGMVLMERAALAVADVIDAYADGRESEKQRVLIVAGMGNNGGDGLALARLLAERGYSTEVWSVGNPDKASDQWREQNRILKYYPVEIGGKPRAEEYTIIVDALFGVGLDREIAGEYAAAVAFCNERQGFKVAVDIPSGVHGDSGAVLGCAFRADVTVTFGFLKRGLVLYPGREYAGEVLTASIGITERSFLGREPGMFYFDEPLEALLPYRPGSGNKGTFGKVLLIAGNSHMAGAAVLAAKAAYRSGAGMVRVLTAAENRAVLQTAVPEALFGTYEEWEEAFLWADMIAIGPGLGKEGEAAQMLARTVRQSDKPLLLDADALNLLSEEENLFQALSGQGAQGREIVITPHVGELSRLTGISVSELKEDLSHYAIEYAARLHGVVVAKDAVTFVCREGKPVCVCMGGNSGMATAGSGDVLTGCLAGLLPQFEENPDRAFHAACVGVYAHADAGARAVRRRGEYACTAGDMAEALLNLKDRG